MILSWYSATQSIWLRAERKMQLISRWMCLCGKQKIEGKGTHPRPISFFLWKGPAATTASMPLTLSVNTAVTRQPLRTDLRTLKLCWRSDSLHRSLPRCLPHLAAVGNISTTCKPIWRVKKKSLRWTYTTCTNLNFNGLATKPFDQGSPIQELQVAQKKNGEVLVRNKM